MAVVLRRCCERYNAALEERRAAVQTSGVSSTLAGQSAQLPAIKAVRPTTATSTPRCCRMYGGTRLAGPRLPGGLAPQPCRADARLSALP